MKIGQLILRKSIKIVATRCPILRVKCTKIDFGWGNTAEEAYSGNKEDLLLKGGKGERE